MRNRSDMKTVVLLLALLLFEVSCSPSTSPDEGNMCLADQLELESEIASHLNAYDADTDFTVLIRTASDRNLSHSTGGSSPLVSYRSASTSKLVTSVVVLDLVQQGLLDLNDHPQLYISSWPTNGTLSRITLRHLLSFTSGLIEEPLCVHLSGADFASCVDRIAEVNASSPEPGERFYYGSPHMQVAGLMAVNASSANSWSDVFDGFQLRTGLLGNSEYDLPSSSNPRLAGGMHWNAEDYLAFLGAIYNKEVLTPSLISELNRDQIGDAVIDYSPALEGIEEDWHYGLGVWVECHRASFDCAQTTTISSAGAYGAYPFIDYANGYYGIVAREGALTTFDRGYELFESVAGLLESWVDLDCD